MHSSVSLSLCPWPWVLASYASDHISGIKQLFTTVTYSSHLPTVTLADISQTQAKGIGKANLLPLLFIDFVLYVHRCPFNLLFISQLTHTLDCAIIFSKDSVLVQNWRIGRMVGIEHESSGFYRLFTLTSAYSDLETPSLTHAILGHPTISKL